MPDFTSMSGTILISAQGADQIIINQIKNFVVNQMSDQEKEMWSCI